MKNTIFSVFLLLLFAMILVGCRRGDKRIFLIPADYQGAIDIFLDRPYGVAPRIEDGSHVYEIPPDGVLFVQFDEDSPYADFTFFFKDAGGKRREIPFIDLIDSVNASNQTPIDSNAIYIYRIGYGGNILNENETLKNVPGYKPGDTVKTFGLVLSSPRDWDSIAGIMLHQHEELYDLAPYEEK